MPALLSAPRSCLSTRGVAGGQNHHLQEGLGADREHRQQLLQPGPACTSLPCPAQTDTAPTQHLAGPASREAGAPWPLSCFLPAVQSDLSAASQGRGSAGATVQRELPWQLGCVPKGCRCSQDTALSRGPGARCSQGTAGDKSSLKAGLSSTCGDTGCATAVPTVGKDGTNVSHLYQVSCSPPQNMLPALPS